MAAVKLVKDVEISPDNQYDPAFKRLRTEKVYNNGQIYGKPRGIYSHVVSTSIKSLLNKIHNEPAPVIILTAFRTYWPDIQSMTMKEAWLRIVYMEAIAGQPWASSFLAYRSEGNMDSSGLEANKGAILAAITSEMDNPVNEES